MSDEIKSMKDLLAQLGYSDEFLKYLEDFNSNIVEVEDSQVVELNTDFNDFFSKDLTLFGQANEDSTDLLFVSK